MSTNFEDLIGRGVTGSKPAAGVPGRLYYDTTLERWERDTGADWEVCEPPGGGGDAGDVTYTPLVDADWDSDTDPGNVDDALDQLAERVDDLEGVSWGGDAGDVTYTPTTAADWDSDADPGDLDDALDQLAERVTDIEEASPAAVTRQVVFTIEGELEVESSPIRVPNRTGAALTISEVRLDVNTAPTDAAIIVDVNENGSTIFATQGNRPQIAATEFTGNTTTFDDASWANGNYLTIDVDQIGSTVPGSDLTVTIVCS